MGPPLAKAYVITDLVQHLRPRYVLFIADTENEILEFNTALHMFDPHLEIITFVPEEDQRENQKQIIRFLHEQKSHTATPRVLVVSSNFLFQKTPSPYRLDQELYRIRKGETVVMRDVCEQLMQLGYESSSDSHLNPGTYRVEGGSINVHPLAGAEQEIVKIELADNCVTDIFRYNQKLKEIVAAEKEIALFPCSFQQTDDMLLSHLGSDVLVASDELDLYDQARFDQLDLFAQQRPDLWLLKITSFPDENDVFDNLRYLSVIKYYSVTDFINDVKEKYVSGWKVVIVTKNQEEMAAILEEYNLAYVSSKEDLASATHGIALLVYGHEQQIPRSFQNTSFKIAVLTDREVFRVRKKGLKVEQKTILDFITSLKPRDYVVHVDHGIGRFLGIDKKTVDGITKEYIEIQYAGNDRLFIPTDQASKVSRFIAGGEDGEPKLTRLDSGEWALINKKVRKETEKIAKELLQLYAKRRMAKGFTFPADTQEQRLFEETFSYEETPGQMKAIKEVKEDMERSMPMDRLICGDVGFGKTEVAMRAAFKAVKGGKQVAFISPVTILADQHYKTLKKRMTPFNVRIEMMSRFRSIREQKETLERLKKGEVDIVVGTHRLLQEDVAFKDLGLVIVDEEQKFGVKQKEVIKKFRCNVDIITLTATPIPRTLNMSLNKLRDITTISTPPPGRLPIITEVRKMNDSIVRDAILYELSRKGQIYFLHNKVQTIESMADKLRYMVPEARFIVAHGQMDNKDLEERVMQFKEGQFDVLVSSTIIENGIDLPNANTLIVNNADQFGLAQLYQLRGRVGRGRQQAFTYLLYHGQRLSIEAKKRLRAIVEASELGSGFQIAMKDLEIRGAGDILGVHQHGVIKTVGVSHFVRMLNQTVEDMKSGKISEEIDVKPEESITIELPLTSFIPETFVPDYKEKISIYQKMSTMETQEELREIKQTLQDEYGALPEETRNLFKVLEVKLLAKEANIRAVRVVNYTLNDKFLELHMSSKITPFQIMHLLKEDIRSTWIISGDKMKIQLKDLGLDWFEGLKQSLIKLIAGKEKTAGAPVPSVTPTPSPA